MLVTFGTISLGNLFVEDVRDHIDGVTVERMREGISSGAFYVCALHFRFSLFCFDSKLTPMSSTRVMSAYTLF